MLRYESGYLSKAPRLFYQAWHPSQSAHGIVLIAHGLGGHGGQFELPASRWAETGLGVYAIDFRGHGRSEGPRGYIRVWNDYLHDLHLLIDHSRVAYPHLPISLWGHSLGGLIALDATLQFRSLLSCLLLSAPAVGQTGVSPLLFTLGQLLSWSWPQFSLKVGFDPRACSRNPDVVQAYNADPLRHSRGTARLSTEFQKAQKRVLASLHQIQVPTLILHGGGDRITNAQDSERLSQALSGCEHQFIRYPHAFHELHLDLNQEQVIADMSRWIESYGVVSNCQ